MTTPVISSVGGPISTGSVLTIAGADMIAEVRTNYDAFFTTQRSGFEGNSPTADGYYTNESAPALLYDSTVKLRGSKSIRMLMQGVHLWPAGDGVKWGWPVVTANSPWVSGPKDVYIRGYSRWNYYDSVTGLISWPRFNASSGSTDPSKKHWWADNQPGTGFSLQYDCNNDGSPPSSWHVELTTRITGIDEKTAMGSFPGGALKNNRWYCMEFHYVKAGSGGPYVVEAWVDGVLIASVSAVAGFDPSNTGGIESKVNEWNTNATWIGYEWCDELAVSTSRIRPLSVVEIGDSATYASAHPKYQYPELLSDTSIQVNCDLTGLTGPNYWMWVTDSTGTRSVTAFSLTGAPDTTAPTLTNANAGTPTPVGTQGAHFDTNEANGTFSYASYTNAATPLNTEVESHTGTGVYGAGSFGSQPVTVIGRQDIASITGLPGATNVGVFGVHRDQAGNLSGAIRAALLTLAADTTPPIISNPTAGTVTSDGCIGSSFDTNEANGIGYRAVLTASGTCTAPQLIAGTGGNIIDGFAWSKPVTVIGTQQGNPNIINGLNASTAYRIAFMHVDASGNQSTPIAFVDFTTLAAPLQTIFFTENFDDANFAARGWFDVVTGTLDGAVYSPGGGASSLKISWSAGMNAPTAPRRHAIPASNTVYLQFWIKLGTAVVPWQGSGLSYHPHIFQILTDADSEWIGPAQTNLSVRIETRIFVPCVNSGDALRIYDDPGTTYPHNNASPSLLGTSAAHSVMGGNGRQNASGNYWVDASSLSGFDNDTDFLAAGPVFVNNTWHKVEYYVAMNSVVAGVPQADGIQRYWVDGNIVINQTAMYWRTGQFAAQKFKTILLVPYIGPPGSPIAQDIWIDNLIVADQQASVGGGAAVASHILRPASTF